MPSPAGTRLDDGFPTFITFSLSTTASLWEVDIKPPGLDAGGPIDTTTMRNTRWRTRWPKALVTATEVTGVCAYDPAVYTSLLSMLGRNQLITITFPDGSTLAIWGWLDKFDPTANAEGNQPRANFTIVPSNQNNSKVETAPAYVTGTTGTTTTT